MGGGDIRREVFVISHVVEEGYETKDRDGGFRICGRGKVGIELENEIVDAKTMG